MKPNGAERAAGPRSARLLRGDGDDGPLVTFMELFFDLVYVFAVTQLSHLLLEHLTWRGAMQTALLLVAVWRAWIDTSWVTNWFHPDRPPVRLMLAALMLGALVMAAALPEAFTDRGLLFAAAYVAMQLGRTVFVVIALGSRPALRRNFERVLAWFVASGILWIAGGVAHGGAREALWVAAVLVDVCGPMCGFFTPKLGRSYISDWRIRGELLAERCGLFIILALGESIVITGSSFGELHLSAAVGAAFVLAFVGTVAMWWIYFDRMAGYASEAIASTDDPGRLGRSAYTYFHLPMVAGIIVAAVGDELSITHPTGDSTTATTLVLLGGPALFLAGHLLFKLSVSGHVYVSHAVAVVVLAGLTPVGEITSPLVTAALATSTLVGVAAWDTVTWRRAGVSPAHS